MINSFNIGKLVYSQLSTLVNNRVYPLIAENGTEYPFIIYERDSINPLMCKDGIYQDEVNITVKVVSSTYYTGLDKAQQTREKLTLHNHSFDNMKVDSEMISADESYENDVYVQTLQFKLKINN